jgi:hypothetical protein
VAALLTALFTYQALANTRTQMETALAELAASKTATSASHRATALSDLVASAVRFKARPNDEAPNLLLVLANIARLRQAGIFEEPDFSAALIYLKSESFFQKNTVLCSAWRTYSASAVRSPELTVLVETALGTSSCTETSP